MVLLFIVYKNGLKELPWLCSHEKGFRVCLCKIKTTKKTILWEWALADEQTGSFSLKNRLVFHCHCYQHFQVEPKMDPPGSIEQLT